MLYQIIWRPKARERFQQIILYLEENWGYNVTEDFKNQIKQVINQIQLHPHQFQKSESKNIYEVLITKHNLLLYRVKNDEIVELLTIFDTRQNPRDKPKF